MQVCTTWNYIKSPLLATKFVNKVSVYRKKCKENAENHHVSKKEMELIVFLTQRQPLAISSPNTLTQIQTIKICSAAVPSKCIKPVWHKSGCSGRVRDQDSLMTKMKSVAPRKARRGCACRLLTLRPSSKLPAYMAEAQLTLVQQICASRMQLKTVFIMKKLSEMFGNGKHAV